MLRHNAIEACGTLQKSGGWNGWVARLSGDNSVALASTRANRSIMRGLTTRFCEKLNLVF
jgi:hypothetical protein